MSKCNCGFPHSTEGTQEEREPSRSVQGSGYVVAWGLPFTCIILAIGTHEQRTMELARKEARRLSLSTDRLDVNLWPVPFTT